jgi:hypothetical protein
MVGLFYQVLVAVALQGILLMRLVHAYFNPQQFHLTLVAVDLQGILLIRLEIVNLTPLHYLQISPLTKA